MLTDQNRREFTRIPIDMEVDLSSRQRERVFGRTRDLSLRGIYLKCDRALPIGADCQAVLYFRGRNSELQIEVVGRVARVDHGGMGIEFTEMGLESLDHLRHLVLYNSGDPLEVEHEYKTHLGLKPRSGVL